MILSFEFEVGLPGARVTVLMVQYGVFPSWLGVILFVWLSDTLAQHGFLSSGT